MCTHLHTRFGWVENPEPRCSPGIANIFLMIFNHQKIIGDNIVIKSKIVISVLQCCDFPRVYCISSQGGSYDFHFQRKTEITIFDDLKSSKNGNYDFQVFGNHILRFGRFSADLVPAPNPPEGRSPMRWHMEFERSKASPEDVKAR